MAGAFGWWMHERSRCDDLTARCLVREIRKGDAKRAFGTDWYRPLPPVPTTFDDSRAAALHAGARTLDLELALSLNQASVARKATGELVEISRRGHSAGMALAYLDILWALPPEGAPPSSVLDTVRAHEHLLASDLPRAEFLLGQWAEGSCLALHFRSHGFFGSRPSRRALAEIDRAALPRKHRDLLQAVEAELATGGDREDGPRLREMLRELLGGRLPREDAGLASSAEKERNENSPRHAGGRC